MAMVDANQAEFWRAEFVKTGGKFSQTLLYAHYTHYGLLDGPFTKSTFVGVREWMENEMKTLHMKYSKATTNKTRYIWLCEHYFTPNTANPENYHRFPVAMWSQARFYRHHFGAIFGFVQNKTVQFIASMYSMWWLHKFSHEVYMIPLPQLKHAYPCHEVPTQPLCEILTFVQQNTFSGIKDMRKTVVTLVLTSFIGYIAKLVRFRV